MTTSGTAPTSNSTATPRSSRPSGSGCSICCRRARGRKRGRSPRRASPAPATTGTRSGTRRCSSCPRSPTRFPKRRRPCCGGGTARSTMPTNGRSSSTSAGAAFPWRTINGEECSGYWPAGTAAFHIGADIADAVIRYVHATGDEEFERTIGLELLTGNGAAVPLARPSRRRGQLPHRRCHRPGRVQRHRGQQRLHQPHGPAEPAGRGGSGETPSRARARARHRRRGDGELARRGRGHVHPVRRGDSACIRRASCSPATRYGISPTRHPTSTRSC